MKRAQQGLTMIEVLAAMVIFSLGAVVLFGWIGQTAERLARFNREQIQLFSELNALEYMKTLNPMRRPEGAETVGDAKFRWAATPVGSEQPSMTPTGVAGIYVVQLYKVELWVEAERSSPVERSLWLAGWRQTRPGAVANPFATPAALAPAATRR